MTANNNTPPIAPYLEIVENGEVIPILTQGNFSVLIGRPKSKKSFLLSALVAAIIKEGTVLSKFQGQLPANRKTILYFDTEHTKWFVNKAIERIASLSGKPKLSHLKAFHLHRFNPLYRISAIQTAIQETPDLGLVVIDTLRDLAIDPDTDPAQASQLLTRLLQWTGYYGLSILVLLNQDDDTESKLVNVLLDHAQTILMINKDSSGPFISRVDVGGYRNDKPIASFRFEVDNRNNCMPSIK